MGQIIQSKLPCPFVGCGSSDAYHIYEDERGQYGYCYSCGKHDRVGPQNQASAAESGEEDLISLAFSEQAEWKEHSKVPSRYRSISTETLEKFGIGAELDFSSGAGKVKEIIFPYYDNEGRKIAEKRDVLKSRDSNSSKKLMPMEYLQGKSSKDISLFGQNRITPGGLAITVTEGEYDAMSVIEMMGDYPVVSIPLGTDGALKCLENEANVEFLRSFSKIMVCFDGDEPGKKAAEEFAGVFVGRAHVVDLSQGKYQDANDYLKNESVKEFERLWWNANNAAPYSPGDIVPGATIVQELLEQEAEDFVPYPYEGLNKMLYGMHCPEVVLVTAPDKVGKSTFTGVLVDHLLKVQDAPVADISLEDTVHRRAKTLLSLRTGRPLHLPEEWEVVDKKELAMISLDKSVSSPQYYGYKNAEASAVTKLMSRIEYLVKVVGCKYVIFDHLSFMTSFHAEDERKTLDRLSNELAVLAKGSNFCLIVVAHLNREGKVHGSSNLEKTCWSHIELNRDKENDAPGVKDIVEVRVKRNRRYARTGKFYIRFTESPFALNEMDTEQAEIALGLREEHGN